MFFIVVVVVFLFVTLHHYNDGNERKEKAVISVMSIMTYDCDVCSVHDGLEDYDFYDASIH